MQSSSRSGREHAIEQQAAACDTRRDFRPVRLPAVAAAVQVNRTAQRAQTARTLPRFLREAHGSD